MKRTGARRLKINRYYMIFPGDSPLERLRKRLTRRPIPRFPRNIQIQTRTGCNADCVFCPYGATAPHQPRGRMDWDLYRKIIDESARHRVRRISPYLMNEPFADDEIFERIAYIHRANPRARVVLTTNGSLLSPAAVDKLLALPGGVHELAISLHGIDPEAYARTVRGGLDFHRTLANVEHLIAEMRRRRRRRPALWITMVDTEVIDARKAVRYWRRRGVNARYTMLENRGGNVAQAEQISHHSRMDYYSDCTRLFKQAYVKFNGDVVLCCTDYEAKIVLGNVREKSLEEVWNGPVATSIRAKFLSGRIGEISLCGACKVDREREVEVRASRPLQILLPPRNPATPVFTGMKDLLHREP
ncbi:MAG TPA: radical SAM/SPASM domain-containing protein [Candidatus Polarisedimenticolia bacterium]|jgi:MoaA/NifB/PqqE/SkfB family radical SAM enzyme|nr:radical SAM/SPASM domain-containing protein [Candidatus Polarisedimenticolia bacterium]